MHKVLLLIIVLTFALTVAINAQDSDTVESLTPIPSGQKFQNEKPLMNFKSSVQVSEVKLATGRHATAITVNIDCGEVMFDEAGGKYVTNISYLFIVRSKVHKTDGFIDGKVNVEASLEELKDIKKCRPIVIRKLIDPYPGDYRIEAILRDIHSGALSKHTVKAKIKSNSLYTIILP